MHVESSDTLWQGCCDCKRDPCGKCRSWAHCAFCKEYEQHHVGGLTIYHHFFCDRMVAPFIVLMQDFPIRGIEAAAKRPVIARWFFTRTHISVSWLCWDEKTCFYFFVYCWSFICSPWAKQKEAAIFCNSDSANGDIGHAEMMNVEKDRLVRSATSTCLETAASVPDFMRTHVEEGEETWDFFPLFWWILCYIDLWFSSYFGLFRFLCPRNKNIQCNALQFLF